MLSKSRCFEIIHWVSYIIIVSRVAWIYTNIAKAAGKNLIVCNQYFRGRIHYLIIKLLYSTAKLICNLTSILAVI